jgi:hypothetical protein
MSMVNAAADRKTGARPFADDTCVDDDDWVGFTEMLGHLIGVAVAVFVPSIALIALLYHT